MINFIKKIFNKTIVDKDYLEWLEYEQDKRVKEKRKQLPDYLYCSSIYMSFDYDRDSGYRYEDVKTTDGGSNVIQFPTGGKR